MGMVMEIVMSIFIGFFKVGMWRSLYFVVYWRDTWRG